MLFLFIIGASPMFVGSRFDGFFVPAFGVTTAYVVLLAGSILMQFSSNVTHGALQGLIPTWYPKTSADAPQGSRQ